MGTMGTMGAAGLGDLVGSGPIGVVGAPRRVGVSGRAVRRAHARLVRRGARCIRIEHLRAARVRALGVRGVEELERQRVALGAFVGVARAANVLRPPRHPR